MRVCSLAHGTEAHAFCVFVFVVPPPTPCSSVFELTCAVMDSFSESLKALFVTWKVPEEFQKHCATMGCEDMDDLALLASNEDTFTDKVLKAANITEGIDQVRSR